MTRIESKIGKIVIWILGAIAVLFVILYASVFSWREVKIDNLYTLEIPKSWNYRYDKEFGVLTVSDNSGEISAQDYAKQEKISINIFRFANENEANIKGRINELKSLYSSTVFAEKSGTLGNSNAIELAPTKIDLATTPFKYESFLFTSHLGSTYEVHWGIHRRNTNLIEQKIFLYIIERVLKSFHFTPA